MAARQGSIVTSPALRPLTKWAASMSIRLCPHRLHFGGFAIRPEVAVRETFYTKSQAPTFVLDPVTQAFVPVYRSASLDRKDLEAGIELRAPVVERDFTPAWLAHFDRVLRHTIEPEAHYRFVSGIDNFRNILRFDPTDLARRHQPNRILRHAALLSEKAAPKAVRQPAATARGLRPRVFAGWLSRLLQHRHQRIPDLDSGAGALFRSGIRRAVFNNRRNVLTSTLDLTGISFLAGTARLLASHLAAGAAHGIRRWASAGTWTTMPRQAASTAAMSMPTFVAPATSAPSATRAWRR